MAVINNDFTTDVMNILPEEEIRVCLFSIGNDTYAIPVDILVEVVNPQKIFPVPTTPSHVIGVVNLRGNIIPIVDIRPALALPPQSLPGQIVVLKLGAMMLGIAVDSVSSVIQVPESSIQTPKKEAAEKHAGGTSRSRFLRGVIRHEAVTAALLDIDRVIDEIRLS